MLRQPGQYPNGYVETAEIDSVKVRYVIAADAWPDGFICTRRDARLFAKRIMECLEGTK